VNCCRRKIPDKVKNLGEYTKAIEQIRHHVRRAGTITHRLLGFSRKISAENKMFSSMI
jgi:two-component system, NtrC family, sensor kinase